MAETQTHSVSLSSPLDTPLRPSVPQPRAHWLLRVPAQPEWAAVGPLVGLTISREEPTRPCGFGVGHHTFICRDHRLLLLRSPEAAF